MVLILSHVLARLLDTTDLPMTTATAVASLRLQPFTSLAHIGHVPRASSICEATALVLCQSDKILVRKSTTSHRPRRGLLRTFCTLALGPTVNLSPHTIPPGLVAWSFTRSPLATEDGI